MKNSTLLAAAVLSACALQANAQTPAPAAPAPAPAAAPAPENTLVPKLALFSEYEYRGISQTSEKPAVQFNLDYTNVNGFYLGTFISNISWLKDFKKVGAVADSSPAEIDLYGGYKWEAVKDVTLDVGYLHYEYAGMKALPGFPKANTDEIYLGATYSYFNVKYSYAFSDLFGTAKSKGSSYLEFNYSQEIAPKWTLNGTIAKQTLKGTYLGFDNNKELSYTVFKLGPTYDLGDGWNVGGYYKTTDAKHVNYTILGKDWSKGRLVAFVSKSF